MANALAIAAVGNHGVVGVNDADDARYQRYVGAFQVSGVAGAVHTLMMAQGVEAGLPPSAASVTEYIPATILDLAVTDYSERDHMPNFNQVLAQLRSERDRAEREVQRLDEAIRVLGQMDRGSRRDGRSARGRFSAATRARMVAAQRARRAKEKRSQAAKPRKMSAAARRKIAAAQRARWARQKAEQKKAA